MSIMAKSNYIKGLELGKKKYSSLSKTELISLRDKYIIKARNYEIWNNPTSEFICNRLDYYCGVIDYLSTLIREFI